MKKTAELWLFHWSPRSRRDGIARRGFRPGMNAVDGLWRPPHVCFADDPMLAWRLSGRVHPEIEEWDLWAVHHSDVPSWEMIFDTYRDTGRKFVKEFRVYQPIAKRHVRYIGSRTQERVRGD